MPAPAQPTGLKLSNVTANSMVATWNAVGGAVAYEVYLNSTPVALIEDTIYSFDRLIPNTRFIIEVAGVSSDDQVGQKAFASATTLKSITNTKKVTIPKASLPPINSDEQKYIVRYRIVSEDRNRVSHWSPQYLLAPQPLEVSQYYDIDVNVSVGFINVIWQLPEAETVPNYDVFVAWGTSPGSVGLPAYFATISGNSAIIPIPTGSQSVRVTVQGLTYPKSYLESMILTQSGIVALT